MIDFDLNAKCTVLSKLREPKRVKVSMSDKTMGLKIGVSNNPAPFFVIHNNEITFFDCNSGQLIIKVRNLSNPIIFTGNVDTVNKFCNALNAFADTGRRETTEKSLTESKTGVNYSPNAGKNFIAHLKSTGITKSADSGCNDDSDLFGEYFDVSPVSKKRRISEGNKENDKPSANDGLWKRTNHVDSLSTQFRDRTNPSLIPLKRKQSNGIKQQEQSPSLGLLNSTHSAESTQNEHVSIDDSTKENLTLTDQSDNISLDDDYDSTETNPSGFVNIGNSCFLNAVLKGIFATPIFREDVLASNHDSAFIKSLKVVAGQNDSLDKKHFPSAVQEIWSLTPLEKFTQQDAHEFLAYVIDRLSNEDSCLVKKNFEIVFEVKFQCSFCEKEKVSQDLAFSIPLPVLDCDFNIADSFDKIFEPEHVSDYKCCDKDGGITLIKRLKTIPRILVLCVMRYSSGPCTLTHSVKLTNRITFSETLSLFPNKHLAETFTSPNQSSMSTGEQQYKLTSVISHIGSNASCGHYVCEVYDLNEEKWYLFDDERVFATDIKEILQKRTENAYIFFYVHSDCFKT